MSDQTLPRFRKNDVFDLFTQLRLDPSDFRWEEVQGARGNLVSVLSHRSRDFHFTFDVWENGYHVRFRPGVERPTDAEFPGNWGLALQYAKQWLQAVRMEITAPPLWEQLAAGQPLLDASLVTAQLDDAPFTVDETAAVVRQLGEVRRYLREAIAPDAFPAIESRLDRIEAAVTTMGKESWRFFVVGTLLTLIWGGLMAPDQARHVLDLIAQAFVLLLGG